MKNTNKVAVCCMAGGYKNAFTQGVLTAFEENGLTADVYTACSSSTLIAAFVAFKIRILACFITCLFYFVTPVYIP